MHPKPINPTSSHETQILALFYRDSERRVVILSKAMKQVSVGVEILGSQSLLL